MLEVVTTTPEMYTPPWERYGAKESVERPKSVTELLYHIKCGIADGKDILLYRGDILEASYRYVSDGEFDGYEYERRLGPARYRTNTYRLPRPD